VPNGSRHPWGAAGALAGASWACFFMPFGLLLGPLLGAVAVRSELCRKEIKPAAVSGVGSVVGTVAGLIVKLAIGVAMICWFVVDVFWIG